MRNSKAGKRNITIRLHVLVLRRLEAKAPREKNNSANHRHREEEEVLDGRSDSGRLQLFGSSNRSSSSSAENRNHLPRAGEKGILKP